MCASPLESAVAERRWQAVDELLKHGANVSDDYKGGVMALMKLAVRQRTVELLDILLGR